MKLSIIIPVYNEAKTIKAIVEKVLKIPHEKEVIIVDDCSTDSTDEVLRKINHSVIIKLKMNKNSGKGAALMKGFENATGDIVLIQDADLEYDPEDYEPMIELINKDLADVVYGSRFLGGRIRRSHNLSNYYGNKIFTFINNLLYNATLTDMNTCYKIIKRAEFKKLNIKSQGFNFEAEFTAKVCKRNLRIYEVPIAYHGRNVKEGKKLKFYHGFQHLWTLLKYRFTD